MKKAWGGFVKGFAKFLDGFFGFLIAFIETLVNLTEGFRYVLGSILSFGCIFILFFPYIFFRYKWLTFAIIFITIFPILGKGFVNYLKYVKYSMVEFLLGYGDYYLNNSRTKYTSYSDYKKKYIFNKQEEERKAREERQRREQEEWTRRFNEWFSQGGFGFDDFGYYQQQGQYRGYNQGYGQQGYGYQNQYQNPVDDFVRTYEKHCDTLGVGYNADKYEIKLNYRKLAKKYHPDINKAADATAKFQEVNNAYDFLSNEQNIERYNRIKNKK
ncbi:J domain-containing protein [uncultured Finegoldia sp.]|uniref:J domain-containing protein n=1 Tax=uncultured Finegoldia sp. TaxID=328009 RepID=UPI002636E1CB|nr:DnaJ domain-containing protein [uncultured Finegoldia sp.]